MEDTNKEEINKDDIDPEWEQVRKDTPGIDDEADDSTEDDSTEDDSEDDDTEDEDKDDDTEDDNNSDDDEDEDSDDDEEDDSEDEDEDDEDDDSDDSDEDEDEDDDESKKTKRPNKYIPLDKYTSEKKGYKKRIKDLEEIIGEKSKATSDAAIKKYAEKHGITEDEAKEHVKDLREVLAASDEPEKKAEFSPEQKQELEKAEEIRAQKAYDDEFDSVGIPALKKQFPKATDKQLKKAKQQLEKISCSEGFLDKTLDYVVFKSTEDLEKIFKTKPVSPEKSRASAKNAKTDLTAESFKEDKTPFTELMKLSSAQQAKIVEEMDIPTYEKLTRFIDANDTLEINRGGRKITF